VLTGVPFVHRFEFFLGLVDGQNWPFGEDIELTVGNDGGDLDDAMAFRNQTGHLQVDPDQVAGVGLHVGRAL
jgi:hypothetical protein